MKLFLFRGLFRPFIVVMAASSIPIFSFWWFVFVIAANVMFFIGEQMCYEAGEDDQLKDLRKKDLLKIKA
jgi:hypothetical protein